MTNSPTKLNNWPVLTTYEGEYLRRVALPIGGIGTGTISLGGRGDLRDWEVMDHPAKGFAPYQAFFALRANTEDGSTFARALEGPISTHDYEGQVGCMVPNYGLPRFAEARFEAAYPLGQVVLNDEECPLQVRLQAFNPLVPNDADASGFPVFVMRAVLHNPTSQTVQASVVGSSENFIGRDAQSGNCKKNLYEWRDGSQLSGIFGKSNGVSESARQWGTLALGVLSQSDQNVSYRTSWKNASWGNTLLDFWDDFVEDGRLDNPADAGDSDFNLVAQQTDSPIGSVCADVSVAPGETRAVTFLLGWHFPNRETWTPDAPQESDGCCEGGGCGSDSSPVIGNYYTSQFSDAWDAIEKFAPRIEELEEETVRFVRAFCDNDFPDVVKEAALYNLSTLRTQTVFRTPDGYLYGWEGCHDNGGCCYGSCTHVWNYEQAIAFTFGDLSRLMRDVEFLHATRDNGLMSFRVHLPLQKKAQEFGIAAADGQLGCFLKIYRDWQLSGDDEWLNTLWPKVKKALEFCWIENGWDGDCDGVMEGCQHNTMDVEYFGPNPQMQGWYLGALRACEEMAKYVGDEDFAKKCRELFENGSAWMDEHLFNGEYYEHEVRPAGSVENIAPGLRHGSMGSADLKSPELQLGAGCLIDQLVGQYFAHVAGLGHLHNPEKVAKTLESIYRYNHKENFRGHFNHMRSYVLGDESALVMASYPLGRRPEKPFPYYNEVMTGFEYTAAVGMLYEGQTELGLKVIADIRERYDGLKRSPFNEAECGHHYARAMASWAAILALSGFEYSAVTQMMKLKAASEKTKWFWSNGNAWGTVDQTPSGNTIEVKLEVLGGELSLKVLELRDFGTVSIEGAESSKYFFTVERQ